MEENHEEQTSGTTERHPIVALTHEAFCGCPPAHCGRRMACTCSPSRVDGSHAGDHGGRNAFLCGHVDVDGRCHDGAVHNTGRFHCVRSDPGGHTEGDKGHAGRSHARAHPGQTERTVSSVLVSTSSTDRNFLLIEMKEKLNGHHYHIDSICCTCSSSPALGSQEH